MAKAWNETKKPGKVFLTWLSAELKMIWERGGRRVLALGVLAAAAALIPGAAVAIPGIVGVLLPVMFYRAYGLG